jgi:hypothetical protein
VASEAIISGKKLEKPENCPDVIYSLMLECWATDPKSRPTFTLIIEKLKEINV